MYDLPTGTELRNDGQRSALYMWFNKCAILHGKIALRRKIAFNVGLHGGTHNAPVQPYVVH